MKSHVRNMVEVFVICGLVAAVILGAISFSIYSAVHETTRTDCKVQDKDRTRDRDGRSDMRVYTTCGNFRVGDSVWKGHFDSSDTFRTLEVGHTYDLTTTGYRVPFLSMFPNVIENREVTR